MAKKLLKERGYLVGVDEAGRGPLAGPVVACAVVIKRETKAVKSLEFKDSKKMSEKKREALCEAVEGIDEIEYSLAVVSEKVIDEVNIVGATKAAMQEAINKVKCPVRKVIIDGNFTVDGDALQEAVVKADTFIKECMLASVIAKVKRDAIMRELHFLYPQYGFDKHKGYGTKKHYEALRLHGITPAHRKSFRLL